MDDWIAFYRERRLRHQLQLLGECDQPGLMSSTLMERREQEPAHSYKHITNTRPTHATHTLQVMRA